VSKKNTIIEINGKRYDVHTGDLLDHAIEAAPKTVARNIDGIHAAGQHRPAPALKKPTSGASRTVSASARKHAPQPSHTLMRHAVKKPGATKQPRQATSQLTHQPLATVHSKASVHRIDDRRLQKASHTPKSQTIHRFNTSAATTRPAAVSLAPFVARHASEPLVSSPQPTQSSRAQTTSDLLQRALEQATSHEQPRLTSKQRRFARSRRLSSISAVSLSVFVLLGVVVYQNMTNIRLQFASAKAGFAVSLPNKQPSGYHLSHLTYQNGLAAFDFASNTDNRAYAIIEKSSLWDSQALREGFVASLSKDYQTITAGGRTVYLYGQDQQNATWVSSGVWYQVETNGSLSARQLVDLASSL